MVATPHINIIRESQFEGFNLLMKILEGISNKIYGTKKMRRAIL